MIMRAYGDAQRWQETSFQKNAQNLEFQCIMDRLKLQVLCVLLSLVLIEEKEAAHRKQIEVEEKERQSKRAIIEPKYQPKGAVIKPSSLAHKVNQRLIN